MLDICPITIGDNAMIGPNCQFLTPLHPLDPTERNSGIEDVYKRQAVDNVNADLLQIASDYFKAKYLSLIHIFQSQNPNQSLIPSQPQRASQHQLHSQNRTQLQRH